MMLDFFYLEVLISDFDLGSSVVRGRRSTSVLSPAGMPSYGVSGEMTLPSQRQNDIEYQAYVAKEFETDKSERDEVTL
jgi:hypothetical protein